MFKPVFGAALAVICTTITFAHAANTPGQGQIMLSRKWLKVEGLVTEIYSSNQPPSHEHFIADTSPANDVTDDPFSDWAEAPTEELHTDLVSILTMKVSVRSDSNGKVYDLGELEYEVRIPAFLSLVGVTDPKLEAELKQKAYKEARIGLIQTMLEFEQSGFNLKKLPSGMRFRNAQHTPGSGSAVVKMFAAVAKNQKNFEAGQVIGFTADTLTKKVNGFMPLDEKVRASEPPRVSGVVSSIEKLLSADLEVMRLDKLEQNLRALFSLANETRISPLEISKAALVAHAFADKLLRFYEDKLVVADHLKAGAVDKKETAEQAAERIKMQASYWNVPANLKKLEELIKVTNHKAEKIGSLVCQDTLTAPQPQLLILEF